MKKKISVVEGSKKNKTKIQIDLSEVERLRGLMFLEKDIAHILGITPETFSRLKKKFPELKQSVKIGQEIYKSKLLKRMDHLSSDGDPQSSYRATKYLLDVCYQVREKTENINRDVPVLKIVEEKD